MHYIFLYYKYLFIDFLRFNTIFNDLEAIFYAVLAIKESAVSKLKTIVIIILVIKSLLL